MLTIVFYANVISNEILFFVNENISYANNKNFSAFIYIYML